MPINRLTAKSITPTFVTDRLGFTPRSETDVDDQISALVDSAPQALNTLNELAAALGDDPNFATTITNSLAGKQATLVSGTNIKTINNTSLLGSGNITVSASAQTTMPVTATSGNTNLKVPFLDTTLNSTGNYAFLQDSSSNFTYNPATNTLNNVTLGSSVSFSSGLPSGSTTTRGAVYGSTSTSGQTYIGYGINNWGWGDETSIGTYSAAGQYGAAVGYYAQAYGKYSVVIGHNSNAGSSHSNPSNGTIIIGSGVSVNSGASKTIYLRAKDSSAGSSADVQVGESGFYVDPITSGTSSNVLYYDSNTKKITYGASSGGGGGGALGDLSDVTISNPTSGQALLYNGTAWVNGTVGEEPPVQEDVYRSTKIVPLNVYRNGSYTTMIAFSNAAEANHVRNFLIKISNTFNNQGGSKFVRFAQSNGYGNQIDIDSNFQGWSNVTGSTLTINNYYVSEPAYPGGIVRVGYYYPDQLAITPDNKLVIGTGNIDSLVTLNPAWSPHGIEVYYPTNPNNTATRYIPASSPSLTPAIREYATLAPNNIEFTLDLNNNPPQQVGAFNGIPYVAFILGKYEFVDPNAPQPWYTVQGAQGRDPLSPSQTIDIPTGYNPSQKAPSDKLMLIGNIHNYSGGSFYFPPSIGGQGLYYGDSIGSTSSNNRTRTVYTKDTNLPSSISYTHQGYGIIACFAQPQTTGNQTIAGMLDGRDNIEYDNRGFFIARNNASNISLNNPIIGGPTGGRFVYKHVVVFNQLRDFVVNPSFSQSSGVLIETFVYTDQYYGNRTTYMFITCNNDQLARTIANGSSEIGSFYFPNGGPLATVSECLSYAWFEWSQA